MKKDYWNKPAMGLWERLYIFEVIRGLCILRPGVRGVSDRIRITSVLGRFLEHERIYHFGNGGQDEYLIGSADWRPRNLRRRVEVVTPVAAPALAARLDTLLLRINQGQHGALETHRVGDSRENDFLDVGNIHGG